MAWSDTSCPSVFSLVTFLQIPIDAQRGVWLIGDVKAKLIIETILGYPAEQIMAMQQKNYVAPTIQPKPGRITPSQYEKNEWSRMATDAYSKDLNDIGHKFSMAATLAKGEDCAVAWFDELQTEYRAWLLNGF